MPVRDDPQPEAAMSMLPLQQLHGADEGECVRAVLAAALCDEYGARMLVNRSALVEVPGLIAPEHLRGRYQGAEGIAATLAQTIRPALGGFLCAFNEGLRTVTTAEKIEQT